jgi:hypothetical protein
VRASARVRLALLPRMVATLVLVATVLLALAA